MTDVDKLELMAEGLKDLVSVGEEILEDGKISFDDIEHSEELYAAVKKIVKAGKAYKEMGEEIKDIDPLEAVKIVQKLLG